MSVNPFVLPAKDYKRDMNIWKHYVRQYARYLSIVEDIPFEEAVNFVKDTCKPGGILGITDPKVIALVKNKHGDREKVESTFLTYVNDIVKANRIMSPSMVCYENPDVTESISAQYIALGIANRSAAKEAKKIAEQCNDFVLAGIKQSEQQAKKIIINSLSGMHGFSGNVLFVKSGHSSLTSMCRAATSYGNANNEKFISGCRFYHSPEVTMANILAIIDNADYSKLTAAIDEWELMYPTEEDTMECITKSSNRYWRNPAELEKIAELVYKLTPEQRAAVVYTGDFYHLAKLNPRFVRAMLDDFAAVDFDAIEIDDADLVLKRNSKDADLTMLVNLIGGHLLAGKGRKQLKESNPSGYIWLAKVARKVEMNLEKYFGFIRNVWVPPILHPSVAGAKSVMRENVLGSDTDSSIFTVQEWVQWYTGSLTPTEAGNIVYYVVVYFSTQCLIHTLATLSANLGVPERNLFRLSMKNEYIFTSFALTPRAKHYFALQYACEGNVYNPPKMEVKGVALRSSIVTPEVIEEAQARMRQVLEAAYNGVKFKSKDWLDWVYNKEQEVRTSILRGEPVYLKSGQMKNIPTNPTYKHYLLWESVFAPKYGSSGAPPYSFVKIPLELGNRNRIIEWVNTWEDVAIRERMLEYIMRNKVSTMTWLALPFTIAESVGIPDEIKMVVNTRKLVSEILESFYIILETLGLYIVDSKHHRLISDIYDDPMECMVDDSSAA